MCILIYMHVHIYTYTHIHSANWQHLQALSDPKVFWLPVYDALLRPLPWHTHSSTHNSRSRSPPMGSASAGQAGVSCILPGPPALPSPTTAEALGPQVMTAAEPSIVGRNGRAGRDPEFSAGDIFFFWSIQAYAPLFYRDFNGTLFLLFCFVFFFLKSAFSPWGWNLYLMWLG